MKKCSLSLEQRHTCFYSDVSGNDRLLLLLLSSRTYFLEMVPIFCYSFHDLSRTVAWLPKVRGIFSVFITADEQLSAGPKREAELT